jgi:hypothetical protein
VRSTQGSGDNNISEFHSRILEVTPSSKLSQIGAALTKRPGRFGGLAFSNHTINVNFRLVLIFAFLICSSAGWARDEKSINDLCDALVGLSPRAVDPHEAELLSVTAHNMSRQLAREYGVTGDPAVHNFLINIGAKKRGICADYTRDIGARLKEFHFKTLVLHWGAAYAKESDENNALVVTARNQPFQDGIVLDGWRKSGRLFWCPVKNDHEYEAGRRGLLGHLGGHLHTGITAWKEDLQETAGLQENQSVKAEPKRKR